MYLQNILKRDDDEITKKVVLLQKDVCYDGDFYPQVLKNMTTLGITEDHLTESTGKLEERLKKNMQEAAYKFLIEKARSHSKVRHECYKSCEGAAHYFDEQFTPEKANLLFRFRTRTFLETRNKKQETTFC